MQAGGKGIAAALTVQVLLRPHLHAGVQSQPEIVSKFCVVQPGMQGPSDVLGSENTASALGSPASSFPRVFIYLSSEYPQMTLN